MGHLSLRVLQMLVCCALLALTPSVGQAQSADHLLITEVLYDPPQAGSDGACEFFQVHNATAAAVDLAGWQIQDNSGLDVLPAFVLAPGEFLVVAASAAGFAENYPAYAGNLVTLEDSIGGGLSNTGDRLILLDPSGNAVDALSYGSDDTIFSPACPDAPAGQSLARVPPGQDTDSAADWVINPSPGPGESGAAATVTSTATGTRDAPAPSPTPTGTPVLPATPTGAVLPSPTWTPATTPTPSPTPEGFAMGDVVITEIMQNPAAVSDAVGEWLELFNATGMAIDLRGWILRDEGSDEHRFAADAPVWLPAGGYLVLGRNADAGANGGVPVGYQYNSFSLGNSADEVVLLDPAGNEIDRVAYDGGPKFPDPSGASMALLAVESDTADGGNWRASFAPWPGSAGDLGSPGAANPLPPIGQIEGHVFEDLNGDGWRQPGEPGVSGVRISLSDGQSIRSFEMGWYGFYDLAPGVYTVTETQPEGFAGTSPDQLTVILGAAEVSLGHDFGEQRVTASPTPTPGGPAPTATVSGWPRVLLSEVLYDAPQEGTDTAGEWIELFATGDTHVDLTGWTVRDNSGVDPIPSFVLAPDDFLVIAADRAGFLENHPGFSGNLVSLEGSIGNGLSNSGDAITLVAPDGAVVDAMSYGTNIDGFDPPCPDVPAGQSLARAPAWQDTDSATDWLPQPVPNPGAGGIVATPTPTSRPTPSLTPTPGMLATQTATPVATFTPTPGLEPSVTAAPSETPTPEATAWPASWPQVRLNELLPRPDVTDWDGDGSPGALDEWIELVNLEPEWVDLGGWMLDDIADGGSTPYVFPPGTMIGPAFYLVRFRAQTGVALNNDADTARLLTPDGLEVDRYSYRNPARDGSYSREFDGAGDWTTTYPPSPGGSNLPPPPPPTGTAGPSPTPTFSPSATPTATPGTYDREAIRLNELLPRPRDIDWDGDGDANAYDEWIELICLSDGGCSFGSWMVDDNADGGSKPYVLPAETTPNAAGFLLLYRRQTGLALNNDEDSVRLLDPNGVEVDSFAYRSPGPDQSYSRLADGTWTESYAPSPGGPNLAPTPTPTPSATPTPTPFPGGVRLNEFLPAPRFRDWDANGEADFSDEWIELFSLNSEPASLGGWALLDDTGIYTLPVGTVIWPGGFLLLYRDQTWLSLGDRHDRIELRRPDAVVLDAFEYVVGPGNDRSYCRAADGLGDWRGSCAETPGEANRVMPTRQPGSGGGSGGSDANSALSSGAAAGDGIAAARAAPPDTRVTVVGAVTLPPGGFGRSIYLQDDSGGIQVYLRGGEYPPLTVGDTVRVTGWIRDFHGERELSVPGPDYLDHLGSGPPPTPDRVATGQIGEETEGRLVWIAGLVRNFESKALILDDGSGPARVFFPAELSWSRPYVRLGELWGAQGIVGQYAPDEPYTAGYRIIPRFETDIAPPPAFLPVTGGE